MIDNQRFGSNMNNDLADNTLDYLLSQTYKSKASKTSDYPKLLNSSARNRPPLQNDLEGKTAMQAFELFKSESPPP